MSKLIKEPLKEQGRTWKWLYSELEVSDMTIRNWRNGKTEAPKVYTEAANRLLGVEGYVFREK